MNDISETKCLPLKDIYYQRGRLKSDIYHSILDRFVELAEEEGLRKKDIAALLGRDQGWVSRELKSPRNWTLETISDLLVAMGAEMKISIEPIQPDNDTPV